MDYMDFIANNYVWFVVGAIVILMAIIGFIAERTDFGKKEFSKKVKVVKEPKKVEEPTIPLDKPIMELVENNTDEVTAEESNVKMEEDLSAPFIEENNMPIDDDLVETTDEETPLPVEEDLTVPFANAEETVSIEPMDEQVITEVVEEEPVAEDIDIELPDISGLIADDTNEPNETKEVEQPKVSDEETEEDIWKF